MKKLGIKDYKAFPSWISFEFGNPPKNMLLFGENGSGKTSIYEAIKLCFYRARLLKPHLTIGGGPLQRANEERDFYRSYNHRVPAGSIVKDFTLEINGTSFKSFSAAGYQCFMISSADLNNIIGDVVNGKIVYRDVINLPTILKRAFFPIENVDSFVSSNISAIVNGVNTSLKDCFIEDIVIGQENANFDIFIKNGIGSLRESNGLHAIFNEAKINLVILLLLFHSIFVLKSAGSHKILVMDDMVTSLDASNRKFLIEFILGKFGDFQKIILTHNIGFNNLFYKTIAKGYNTNDWIFQNIYLTNAGPHQYFYDEFGNAREILDQFNNGMISPGTVGNILRKRFEAVVYELAKAIQVGEVHQATNLVARMLDSTRPLYVRRNNGKYYGGDDLVNEIKTIISSADSAKNKLLKISNEISKYATDADMQKILPIIKEMHFFEKIMIHQLSHGATAMPNFNKKEVENALKMLVSLESLVKQYVVSCRNSWSVMM